MATAQVKKTEYIARTAFSMGEVIRTQSETERRADLIQRGGRIWLTDEQAQRFARFIAPIDAGGPGAPIYAKDVAGHIDGPTREAVNNSLKGSGALPITDKSGVIGEVLNQAEANSPQPQDQPSTNI
jgi:hypothetical protein